jgi:hypothetical protein
MRSPLFHNRDLALISSTQLNGKLMAYALGSRSLALVVVLHLAVSRNPHPNPFASTRIEKIIYALDDFALALSSSLPVIQSCSVHSPVHENDNICPRRLIACPHSWTPPRHLAGFGFEAVRSTQNERITYARDIRILALPSRPNVIQSLSI